MPDNIPVSCLMVTLPSRGRAAFVMRSIAAYCAQTHTSKELVIVQDAGDPEVKAELRSYVAGLGRGDIKVFEAPPGLTLGALRNLSRFHASGTVLCQWDDDDLFHAQRVEMQLAALLDSGKAAVGLQEVLHYFPANRAMYWTNWRHAPATIMPSTIMFRSDAPLVYPETGPEARLGEDSAVCEQLLAADALIPLPGMPQLSVYVSHGANTWDDGHHAMLANTFGISHGLIRRREGWLREQLALFDFGPGQITVRGPHEVAFTLDC